MQRYASLFLVSLLVLSCCSSDDTSEMNRLGRAYIESGRTAESEEQLRIFWAVHDSVNTKNGQYLLEKYLILSWMGKYDEAAEVFSYVDDDDLTERIGLFNRLQARIYEGNYPASLKLLRKLSSVSPVAMDEWLHNSFAQFFMAEAADMGYRRERVMFVNQLDAPSHPVLAEASSGLQVWVKAQQAANSPEKLKEIASLPIRGQYARAERYRLLLFQIMAKHGSLLPEAVNILDRTITDLRSQASRFEFDRDNAEQLSKRARSRYLLAHAYFLKAQQLLETDDNDGATGLLKLASEYSPDAADRSVRGSYFYEMALLGGEEEYSMPYVLHLQKLGETQTALDVYVERALYNPEDMKGLRDFYRGLPSEESFADFWRGKTSALLPQAPQFTLTSLDNQEVSLSDYTGKWLLIDFWGTWCRPCVAEVQDIQRLHNIFERSSEGKAKLLSVACRDKREAVVNFMKKEALTYSVVMADNRIEAAFEIASYPTKVLIFPNGHYLRISSSREWMKQVKEYLLDEGIIDLEKVNTKL